MVPHFSSTIRSAGEGYSNEIKNKTGEGHSGHRAPHAGWEFFLFQTSEAQHRLMEEGETVESGKANVF